MIVLFVVLLVLPHDRLRGATLLRTTGALHGTDPALGRRPGASSSSLVVLLLEQIMGTADMGALSDRHHLSRSSPCRSPC